MIKTTVSSIDEKALVDLGYRFHQESQFRDTSYNVDGVLRVIHGASAFPDKMFIGFDDEYKGVIILQISTQFFSGLKWAGDQVFYVNPEERGSGLAKELLDAGAQWAKDRGAKELVILHNAGIGEVPSLYAKEGFELSGLILNKAL